MSEQTQRIAIDKIIDAIDIPDSAYDQAHKRYHDLGQWFSRKESACSGFSPHIFAQGSFRLGTVNRPMNEGENYDLDMNCRMRQGISKWSHSQKRLKDYVHLDLEAYRNARQIKDEIEEKHRCWCLNYQDELSFHMDVVPSIPEEMNIRKSIKESMVKTGQAEALAESVAQFVGAITDNRHPKYETTSPHWLTSNSEGYAIWFESRMRLSKRLLEKAVTPGIKARVDDLPVYKMRTILQRCVQILKRHRDTIFEHNPDSKPASIIITTLAARAYQGEDDIREATRNTLSAMGNLVNQEIPRIQNPINPAEDFADRWYSERGQELELEKHFWGWLEQAKADIGDLALSEDADYLIEKSLASFKADVNADELKKQLSEHGIVKTFAIGGLAPAKPSSPIDLRGGGRNG